MAAPLPKAVRFLKRYARRLHEAGVPAHQLEDLLHSVARALSLRCDVWSSPTAIFLAVQHLDDEEDLAPIPMQLIRLQPGSTNLAETAGLYDLGDAVIEGRMDLEQARASLEAPPAPPRYGLLLQLLAGAAVSASFALLLGSSALGALVAGLAGTLVGGLPAILPRLQRMGSLEALAALGVSLFVYACDSWFGPIDSYSLIMSGLIVLMPGLALTIAVTELSTNHLASGSARLAGALVVLLKLVLGVVVGTVVAGWLGWQGVLPEPATASRLPAWVQPLALLMASLGFAVLFNVRRRDIFIAVLAAVTGYTVSRLGVVLGGLEFGVLLAAFAVAVLGNTLGRWLRRPASLVRVPGIILLVPGALGYRTVANVLLAGSANPRETALTVAMLVIALVGGLLLGNTLIAPRRYV